VHLAAEPFLGQPERDRLQPAQFRRMQAAPFGPQSRITGMRFQEAGDLADLHRAGVAVEQVAQHVNGAEGQSVGRRERLEAHAGQRTPDTPRPELLQARNREAFHRFIPEMLVQVDGDGDLGIVEVAVPFPVAAADQGEWAFNRLVALPQQRVADTVQALRAEEVEIVLDAVVGPDGEEVPVGEAFQPAKGRPAAARSTSAKRVSRRRLRSRLRARSRSISTRTQSGALTSSSSFSW